MSGFKYLVDEIDVCGEFAEFTYDEWVKWFSQGQCHALACAIEELTGWQMWMICTVDEDDFFESNGAWCHVVVESDGGKFLDIHGLWDAEELIEWWDPHLPHMWACGWGHTDLFREEREMDLARTWARAILSHLGVDYDASVTV